jgi:hypothetical protein
MFQNIYIGNQPERQVDCQKICFFLVYTIASISVTSHITPALNQTGTNIHISVGHTHVSGMSLANVHHRPNKTIQKRDTFILIFHEINYI